MTKIFFAILATYFVYVYFANINSSEAKGREVVSYISVEGTCYEDNVNLVSNYSGYLAHWYDNENNTEVRAGSVQNEAVGNPDLMLERAMNTFQYQPPLSIFFWGVEAELYDNPEMKVTGFVEEQGEKPGETKFESPVTCNLKVLERLDDYPTAGNAATG